MKTSSVRELAHLRVEPQLADAAGDMLPLGGGREAQGVVEDGFLHRVHLEDGETSRERIIKTPCADPHFQVVRSPAEARLTSSAPTGGQRLLIPPLFIRL